MSDESIKQALRHVGHHFECFARNGRWGTCGFCPRTSDGRVFPEFCKDTDRYDHQLTLESLVEQYNHHAKAKP